MPLALPPSDKSTYSHHRRSWQRSKDKRSPIELNRRGRIDEEDDEEDDGANSFFLTQPAMTLQVMSQLNEDEREGFGPFNSIIQKPLQMFSDYKKKRPKPAANLHHTTYTEPVSSATTNSRL